MTALPNAVPEVQPPTGVITFLFTDVEGSTRLWREQPDAMAAALEEHDQVVRSTLAANDGYVFGVGGDGFFSAFSSPRSGLDAAIALQQSMHTNPLIDIRIGLHTGEANFREGGFFGLEINRTARITTLAHGGQVVLSGVTAALLGDAELEMLGTHRLNGIEGTTDIWQHGSAAFPALRSDGRIAGNLASTPADRFIGREQECGELTVQLRDNPLVSVVGPGGMGKTRLAVECGVALRDEFRHGVWMVSLATLEDADLISSAIADALEIERAARSTDLDVVRDWFGSHSALVILDNCEHIVDQAAEVVDELLRSDAEARLLVTSQVPLGVRGEHVMQLGPLAGGTGQAGSALFAERACALQPEFDAEAHAIEIAEICGRLDDLPLAIELAASLVRAMNPPEILGRLEARLRLLSSRNRGDDARHRSLENALRWSYDLLEPIERRVLRRLAVFAGPFTLEQAQAVIADDDLDQWDVFDALVVLVDRSLVARRAGPVESRYYLLESVKALGRLENDREGESDTLRLSYAESVAAFVLEVGSELLGPDDRFAHERILAEWPHVRALLQYSADDLSSDQFEQVYAALGPLWNQHGRTTEGAEWAEDLLLRSEIEPHSRVPALVAAANVVNSAKPTAGGRFSAEAERLWREYGAEAPVSSLSVEALNAMHRGNVEDAMRICREVIELCRGIERPSHNRDKAMTMALSLLSIIEPDLEIFTEAYERERAEVDLTGVGWYPVQIRAAASRVADRLDLGDATAYVAETARLQLDRGYNNAASHTFEALSDRYLGEGRVGDAAFASYRAIELTVEHAAGFLWNRILHTVFVLVRAMPREAALLTGFERAYRARHNTGRSVDDVMSDAEIDAALAAGCDDVDLLLAEGAELDDAGAVDIALAALETVMQRDRAAEESSAAS